MCMACLEVRMKEKVKTAASPTGVSFDHDMNPVERDHDMRLKDSDY